MADQSYWEIGNPASVYTDSGGSPFYKIVPADTRLDSPDDLFGDTWLNSPDAESAPAFSSSPVLAASIGSEYTYNVSVSGGASPYTITAPAAPSWLVLVDNGNGTATLSGTPGSADHGKPAVQLQVEGANALTALQDFEVTISMDTAGAPVFPPAAIDSQVITLIPALDFAGLPVFPPAMMDPQALSPYIPPDIDISAAVKMPPAVMVSAVITITGGVYKIQWRTPSDGVVPVEQRDIDLDPAYVSFS